MPPIAPELRQFYRTPEWFASREIVATRAKGKCEWCKKPKGIVLVALDGSGRWYNKNTRQWVRPPSFPARGSLDMRAEFPRELRKVVLTVAHLDHDPETNEHDPERLAHLCQRCHLLYDGPHHRATARLRRDRATGQLRLELTS